MTQNHETRPPEARYDFYFQMQLAPEQALLHLGLEPSSTTPSWIKIETNLTESEALQACRKLWPENGRDAAEMVRHHGFAPKTRFRKNLTKSCTKNRDS